jgi:autotransporter adhesin
MAIGSVMGNGLSGIQRGFETLNKASAQIARVGESADPSADLTAGAISLLQGKLQVEASAKVLETANKTMGSIIDIEI